jgi:hypothetical protein
MKRSQALAIINELDDADQILTRLENIGMLPPPCPGVYDTVPTVTPTGNLNYSWKKQWEPENE